jgi:hypothetical protein
MSSFPLRPFLTSATVLVVMLAGLSSAQAFHGRFVSGHGFAGRSYAAGRAISRTPGSTTATRGIETGGGRGFVTTRQTNYGDGNLTNNVTRTYNNGETATRTGSITRNPDGSVTKERTHTGVDGNTQTGWSTIYKTDDGIGRTRGVTTSSGKSVTETGSIASGEGSMTVDRAITTGSGASASRTTTYTRGY